MVNFDFEKLIGMWLLRLGPKWSIFLSKSLLGGDPEPKATWSIFLLEGFLEGFQKVSHVVGARKESFSYRDGSAKNLFIGRLA
jgi:hypothetical protein